MTLLLVLALAVSAVRTAASTAPPAKEADGESEGQEPQTGPDLRPRAFHYAESAAIAVPILSQPASYERPMRDAFTQMQARAVCDRFIPRAIDATLDWSSTREGIVAYRVDITEFNDGFTKGRFRTSGERPTSVKELPFLDADPGIFYYWRVLAKTADGWVVAGTGRFDAPICPADEHEGEDLE